jgi:phospho-N-acetylmuramoyl-pentapeptide-transferase
MFANLLISHLWIKAFLAFFAAFLFSFFSIKNYIKFASNNPKFFQPIRKTGPETHLASKQKTPTMGGVFIILSTLASVLLFTNLSNRYIWVVLIIMITFAIIGFIDDFLKVFYRNSKGFRGSYKIIIQFSVISLTFLWLGIIDLIHLEGKIFLPFQENFYLILPLAIYILFINLVIVGSANAVNLTDGLDGLVSIPAIINLLCLIFMIFASSSSVLATKFQVSEVKFSGELIFFCFAMIGSIIGFLCFNLKPAKVFMGDVGSLSIGASIGLIALIIKQEAVFFIISLLFVIEATSVILQVGSYKIRKKRIFLMAPIHHHFEKLGWSEQKVVKNFWLASLIFALLGILVYIC